MVSSRRVRKSHSCPSLQALLASLGHHFGGTNSEVILVPYFFSGGLETLPKTKHFGTPKWECGSDGFPFQIFKGCDFQVFGRRFSGVVDDVHTNWELFHMGSRGVFITWLIQLSDF